jgi:hypothetical protein
MDTKKDSSVSDVPTFKVARVGQDRKRKGGGFSFLRGGSGTRGVWSGATGGSGVGGGAAASAVGMTFSKTMLMLVVMSSLGAAGIQLGKMRSGSPAPDKKPAIFSDKGDIKLEGDTSNLPSNANTIPNSLGYLSGSRDGLTPEERAKKEAEAAAAAEAQRLADEEAAKKAEADNLAGKPVVDPNALLASAQAGGGKGSAFGKKFGSLSSSMGGGSSLSGGAGLSGGVNRQFGGSGAMGKIAGGSKGQLSAMKGAARPSYSKAGGARMASSKTKGFARKQLANANAYSRRASAASKGETAASDAGTAFDNNPGAGNVISGPGVANGARPQGVGDNTPNAVNNGGPTGGDPTVDCGPNNYQTADGGCAPINTDGGKDANPALTMMANVAMALMLVIGVISAFAALTRDSVILAEIYPMLAAIVGALGIVVTLLGVAMISMGDYVAGGIATLVGGYVSYMSYISPESLTVGQGMVAGLGGAALSLAGKMLSGDHKGKAPEAAQQ